MTNYANGHQAETVATTFLRSKGYKIIEQNWRTRQCEIDIIASRRKAMYFFEVKYRQNTGQGSGLEYITAKKLQQMRFAAEYWVAQNNWRHEYQLGAIEVSGESYEITEFVTDIVG